MLMVSQSHCYHAISVDIVYPIGTMGNPAWLSCVVIKMGSYGYTTEPHAVSYANQCCARYYLEDSIFILKVQDSISSCIFKILFNVSWQRLRYFLKVPFTRYFCTSTRIISLPFTKSITACSCQAIIMIIHNVVAIIAYWSTSHPFRHYSESTNTRKTNMAFQA